MLKDKKIRFASNARIARLLVSASSLVLVPAAAFAQQAPVPADTTTSVAGNTEIVVTGFKSAVTSSALKGDIAVRDIPLTVSGYSEEFIKDVDVVQVADLYNYMVGVQRAGPTGYDISIRGFTSGGSDRGSIQINGLPGLAVRFGSPPTVNVEKIEVVKGPTSVLYGQVQPGGFVNIITKKPERNPHYTFSARVEGYPGAGNSIGDTFGAVLNTDLTGPINDSGSLDYRLVGEYQNRDGFSDHGFSRSYFVSPSVSAELGPDTDLLVEGEYQYTDTQLFNGLVAYNNDIALVAPVATNYQQPGDYQQEEGFTGGLTLTHRFSNAVAWRTAFRAVKHKDITFGLENLSFRNSTTLRRRVRDQINEREYYFADSNLNAKFTTLGIDNNMLLGVNGGRETSDFNRVNFDSGNKTADIDIYNPIYTNYVPRAAVPDSWRHTTLDSIAVYVQDQLKFSEQWKAVAAIRWEHFNVLQADVLGLTPDTTTSGSHVSPMAGLIFQPDEHWSIYASYASSFSAPSPGAVDINNNPINTPEKASQIESGVKASLMRHRLDVTLSVFDIKKKNVIESLGSGFSRLAGGERSTGGEIEVDATPLPNWKIIAGYSYIKARVSEDIDPTLIGVRLSNAPVHTASLFTSYDFDAGALSGVGLSFGVNYASMRYGTQPTTGSRLVLPGYTVVDAGIHYNAERYSVTLQAKNLFDKRYYESASNNLRISPGAPRSVSLTLKVRL